MIVFDKVTRSFFPGNAGVFNLSFAVASKEAVVLTGRSGAGKTTIMKLLIREYRPESGNIYLDEVNYQQLKNSQIPSLKRRIGVVFQDFLLINELTAWENIALPLEVTDHKKDEIKKRVTDLIKLVGLEGKEALFPNQLSGGEAGRVGIARALALAPEVIFADEPTGNLDPQTSLEIAQILKKINQLGTTLMLATHDPIIVDLFKDDRIIKLDAGQIISDTKPKPLDSILARLKAKQPVKKERFFGWFSSKRPPTKKQKPDLNKQPQNSDEKTQKAKSKKQASQKRQTRKKTKK